MKGRFFNENFVLYFFRVAERKIDISLLPKFGLKCEAQFTEEKNASILIIRKIELESRGLASLNLPHI